MASLRIADLKAEATLLEKTLTQSGIERSQGRPAKKSDVRDWFRYVVSLHRDHARGGGLLESGASAAEQDSVLLDAIRSAPETVLRALEVTETGELALNAETRAWRVWPKSFDALVEIYKYDFIIGWIAVRLTVLREQDEVELVARCMDEIRRLYQILAWVATTPGPRLPQELESDPLANPPDVYKSVDIIELVNIAQSFVRVNNLRLRYLSNLISAGKNSDDRANRPVWSIFFSSASIELKVEPSYLMRDVALCEVLAQVRLAQIAREDAVSSAKGD